MTDFSKSKETLTPSPKQAEKQTPEYLLLKEEWLYIRWHG